MAHTTKSQLNGAGEALALGERSLAKYGNKYRPKKYSQAQLVAILGLRQFFCTDYRGIVAILEDGSELRKALGLTTLPHYATLSHAARRFEKRGTGNLCAMKAFGQGNHCTCSEKKVAAQ